MRELYVISDDYVDAIAMHVIFLPSFYFISGVDDVGKSDLRIFQSDNVYLIYGIKYLT